MKTQPPYDNTREIPAVQRRLFLKTTMALSAGAGLQALSSSQALAAEAAPIDCEMHPVMQSAIKACMDCHSTCLRTVMAYCLEEGGRHASGAHVRLMLNCAELCQTSANFMLSNSPLHSRVCGVCAEACEACARSCEEIGGMAECRDECLRCAESCRSMT